MSFQSLTSLCDSISYAPSQTLQQHDQEAPEVDLSDTVTSMLLSTEPGHSQDVGAEHPYPFVKSSQTDTAVPKSQHLRQSQQAAGSNSGLAQSVTDSQERSLDLGDLLRKSANINVSKSLQYSQLSRAQREYVSPEAVVVSSFSGEEYHLPDGKVARRSPPAFSTTRNASDNLALSALADNSVLTETNLDASLTTDRTVSSLLERISIQQTKLSDVARQYPARLHLAEIARNNEKILEFLTNATTDEEAFNAEYAALTELRDIWHKSKPELYRLVTRYCAVKEQLSEFTKIDMDREYLTTLRSKLSEHEQALAVLKETHPEEDKLFTKLASANSQLTTMQQIIESKQQITTHLTQLKAELYKLRENNKEVYDCHHEAIALDKELATIQNFRKNPAAFERYKHSVLQTYESLQTEAPETVATYLELKQVEERIVAFKNACNGTTDIVHELCEARRKLAIMEASDVLLTALLKNKRNLEAQIDEIKRTMDDPSQLVNTITALQSILKGIKTENPEVVELMEQRASLEAKIKQIKDAMTSNNLREEVYTMQTTLDDLSRKHPDILTLIKRKAELQDNINALMRYATNVSALEIEIDKKVQFYAELSRLFPDLEEKLALKRKLEIDAEALRKLSNNPAKLVEENALLNKTYEHVRSLSPVIKSMLDTHVSLISSISEAVQKNEEDMSVLRKSASDEEQTMSFAPPPDPQPVMQTSAKTMGRSTRPRSAGGALMQRTSVAADAQIKTYLTSGADALDLSTGAPRKSKLPKLTTRNYQDGARNAQSSKMGHILEVQVPHMMNSFFGIALQHDNGSKDKLSLSKLSEPSLRRTIV